MPETPATIRIHKAASRCEQIRGEPGLCVLWPNGQISIWCPRCGTPAHLPYHDRQWTPGGAVTLTPSIICAQRGCGADFHIRENRIEFC